MGTLCDAYHKEFWISLVFNPGHTCTRWNISRDHTPTESEEEVDDQLWLCQWQKNHFLIKFKCLSKFYILWGWCIFLMQWQMIECDQSKNHQETSVAELRSMRILTCYNLPSFLQVFIICILSNEKYQHFQDVLTTYIEKHFSAALAHKYVQTNSDLSVTTVC